MYIIGVALDDDDDVSQISHLSGALTALQKVHDVGYVHGAVSFANIIYDRENTHLIDYELARSISASPRYPRTHSTEFPERHTAAQPLSRLDISHELYSMRYIMVASFPQRHRDLDRCGTVKELMDLAKASGQSRAGWMVRTARGISSRAQDSSQEMRALFSCTQACDYIVYRGMLTLHVNLMLLMIS